MWNRCTARHVFTYTRYVGDHCGRKISKNGKAAYSFLDWHLVILRTKFQVHL